jgi:hypothetical protein
MREDWKCVVIGIWLLYMTYLDLRDRRIPLGVLALGLFPIVVTIPQPLNVYGLVPGFFLLIASFFKKAGIADGFVVSCLGLALPSRPIWGAVCISLLMMAMWSIGLLAMGKADRSTRFPYIPFLFGGYVTVWICS